jgi:hypothetical protein
MIISLLSFAQVNHSGTISVNETWTVADGQHFITGHITVADGVTLTIEEGCEVYFNAGRRLLVRGALIADGSSANPILFSANTVSPTAGYWQYIYFNGADAGSILDNCTVEYGGSSNGAILMRSSLSNVTISNTTVSQSGGYGIRLLNGADSPSINDCSFDNCANYPIYTYADRVKDLTGTMSFTSNVFDAIYVRNQNVNTGTWLDHGVPYVLGGNTTINDLETLTINPGVEVSFNGNFYLRVNGGLVANGTDANHIVFSSNQTVPAKGDWNRIYFNVAESSSLSYCEFLYAGSGTSAIDISNSGSNVTIANCFINNSEGYGIYSRNASEPNLADLSIQNCDDFAIRIQADAVKGIAGTMSFAGNTPDKVRVDAQGINTATWNDIGYPYVMWADMNVNDLNTLTIMPGTQLQFNTGARLQVYGSLVADGEDVNKITFTSFQDVPAPGDWEYLYFNNADPGCILDYCDILYSGSNANGAVYVNNSGTNVAISNCLVDNSATYGIRVAANSAPSISNSTITNSGDYAIRTTGDNVKYITGTMAFSGNTPDAIRVDAQNITTGTWFDHGVPYVMWADMNQVDANTLTLNPGVELRFNTGARLRVYGTLIADGEEANPIVFTSNSDTPAPADWERLLFEGADAGTILDHCQINYAGGVTGNIDMNNCETNIAISNTLIENSAGIGVNLRGGSSPSFINCKIINNDGIGVYINGACSPTFGSNETEWNDIYGNGSYELRNGSLDIDAMYVYWGVDGCGMIDDLIFDNNDQGNLGMVNYFPYLDAGHGVPSLATTWTGAMSNSWHDDDNWTNYAPCRFVDATIPAAPANQPFVYGPETCNNLTIEGGAQLTIGTGNSLDVNGDLYLEANAAGTASLLENGGLSVAGSTMSQLFVEEDRWHHFSSPMTGQTANTFLGMLLYGHDEATNNFVNIIPETTPLGLGIGYEVWSNFPDQAVEFVNGNLNSGVKSLPVSNNGSGWNFVGNPYPSAIDWDDLSWIKTYIDGTVYVYDGTQYLSWNGSTGDLTGGIIPAMQGFFVKANGPNPALTVNNGARTHGVDPYKEEKVDELLKITITGNGMYDRTFVNFNKNATVGIDHNLDGYKIMGHEDAPQLYSMVGGEKMRVNVLPEITSNLTILLGLEVNIDGEYNINASELGTFNSDVQIYLEDVKTGDMSSLNEQPNYSFMAYADDENQRFKLHFFMDTSVEEVIVTETQIYSNEKSVFIKNTNGSLSGSSVMVYNIAGQKVYEGRMDDAPRNQFNLNLKGGYYVVKVTSSTETITEKVFIK